MWGGEVKDVGRERDSEKEGLRVERRERWKAK